MSAGAIVHLRGLDEVVRALEQLPGGITGRYGGAARKALRVGANIVREAAQRNLRAAIAAPGATGITASTGFTARQLRTKVAKVAIRRRYLGGQAGEMVVVTTTGAPHPTSRGRFRGRPIRANDIAFILEVGAEHLNAIPWLRPAFLATAPQALAAIEAEMLRSVGDLWAKHIAATRPI